MTQLLNGKSQIPHGKRQVQTIFQAIPVSYWYWIPKPLFRYSRVPLRYWGSSTSCCSKILISPRSKMVAVVWEEYLDTCLKNSTGQSSTGPNTFHTRANPSYFLPYLSISVNGTGGNLYACRNSTVMIIMMEIERYAYLSIDSVIESFCLQKQVGSFSIRG